MMILPVKATLCHPSLRDFSQGRDPFAMRAGAQGLPTLYSTAPPIQAAARSVCSGMYSGTCTKTGCAEEGASAATCGGRAQVQGLNSWMFQAGAESPHGVGASFS